MKRKYPKPPIVEAVIEFQFVPGQPWDITVPGIMYEKVRKEFPEKKEQVQFISDIKALKEGVGQQISTSQRMQFIRSDNSALLQISRNIFTVNHLKPYSTWDNFKPLILKNLKLYVDVVKPKGLKRLGLRYINKIEFKNAPFELTDYFNYYPFIPKNIPQLHEQYNCQVEIPFNSRRDLLRLATGSTNPEAPNKIAILLDLDYIMMKPETVNIEEFPEWLENAHTVIEETFEACITDKCRKLFEEKK